MPFSFALITALTLALAPIAAPARASAPTGLTATQKLLVSDAQLEKASDNLRYWNAVARGLTASDDAAFARERIRVLTAEVERLRRVHESHRHEARSEPRFLVNEVLERQVAEARAKAEAAARALMGPNGAWSGPSYLDPFLTAEYIACLKVLGRLDEATARKAERYFLRIQHADGSFTAWGVEGPGQAPTTYTAHVALRTIGTPEALKASERARQWLVAQGSFEAAKHHFTLSLMSGLLGYEPYKFGPGALKGVYARSLPVLGVKRWSSWIQALYVPKTILQGIGHAPGKQVTLGKSQRKQLRKLVRWLATLTDPNGQYYINSTTNVLGILAYHYLTKGGHGDYTDKVEAGLAFLRRHMVEETELELLVRNPPSENWDNPLMLLGILGDRPSALRAAGYEPSFDYLYATQVLGTPGSWSANAPGVRPGGWSTVADNWRNPDIDGTGKVLQALRLGGRIDPDSAGRNIRGLNWLLGLQGKQGGWATFERSKAHKPPGPMRNRFDVQTMALGGSGRNAVTRAYKGVRMLMDWKKNELLFIDFPFSDLTGHVVSGLTAFGFTQADPPVSRALEFMRDDLGGYPVWFSRYGIDYYWGTLAAVEAFREAGADMSQDFIQRAAQWVLDQQNADGGWGVELRSVESFSFAGGKGRPSVASQTAQALLILVAAGKALTPEAERAAAFLMRAQDPEGRWIENTPNSWAGQAYFINYSYLAQYMSMIALSRFGDELERAGRL